MAFQLKISCYNCQSKLDVSEIEAFTRINCPACGVEIIVPKPFGNLLLEERLGVGLMTTAYRAMDITLEREIVVKVLRDEYLHGSRVPELFIGEARSSSAINHPNVVPIYSCGERDGKPFIVTQFMEGGSLASSWLHNIDEPPPVERAVRWFRQAVHGLESAHLHGLLHHDVFPGCILLDLDDEVKVGDFGLLQALYRGVPLLPGGPGEAGAPPLPEFRAQYVSPERIEDGTEDVEGDIYSLGATFYHVLTGSRPFPGVTAAEVLTMHLEHTPRPAAELNPMIPAELSDLLARMLAPDPGDRPQGYREVSGRLNDLYGRLSHDRQAAPTPTAPATRSPVSRSVAAPRPKPGEPVIRMDATGSVRSPRRSRWRWLGRFLPLLMMVTVLLPRLPADHQLKSPLPDGRAAANIEEDIDEP